MIKPTILLVDDDRDWLKVYVQILEREGYVVDPTQTLKEAFEKLDKNIYDVVITDLIIGSSGDGELGGVRVVQKTRDAQYGTETIIITAYGTTDRAIHASQKAGSYIEKDIENVDNFLMSVRSAVRFAIKSTKIKRDAHNETSTNQSNDQTNDTSVIKQNKNKLGIIGNTPQIQGVFTQIKLATNTLSPVLVWGESGVGKRLVAETIHQISENYKYPFFKVPCKKLRSFEDVIKRNLPSLENGTIFLHNLGDLGENQNILFGLFQGLAKYNIRIISSITTKSDLNDTVEYNQLDQQLVRDLSEISIQIPPLRYRKKDIDTLTGHFIKQLLQGDSDAATIIISENARRLLFLHDYVQDNVRELQSVIRTAVELLGRRGEISTRHLHLLQNVEKGQIRKQIDKNSSKKINYFQWMLALNEYFDEVELKELCFRLNIDYENLPAEGKKSKSRELVDYSRRHNRQKELFEYCKWLRPNVPWAKLIIVNNT